MTCQPVFGSLPSLRWSVSLLSFCLMTCTQVCWTQQTSVDSEPTPQVQNSAALSPASHQAGPISFALEYNGLPDAPSSQKAPPPDQRHLSLEDRLHVYGEAVLRPGSILAPGLGVGFGQYQMPPEWGPGGAFYAREMAAGISRHAVGESIRFGLAALDGEDPRYHRSEETGLLSRTRHVLVESFTSQTADGGRMPAFSRFAGAYGSAFLSTAWCPEARYDPNWALRRGTSAFASSVGLQLVQEFIPQKYLKRFGLADKMRP